MRPQDDTVQLLPVCIDEAMGHDMQPRLPRWLGGGPRGPAYGGRWTYRHRQGDSDQE